MSSDLAYWLAALQLPGIGSRKLLRWLDYFSNIQSFFQAKDHEYYQAGLNEQEIAMVKTLNWDAVEKELIWRQAPNHSIMTIQDDDYPLLLKEISYPPLVLYIKGNRSILSAKQIAIVGSRHATHSGLCNAKQFAKALVEAGLTITSGLAKGIDGAAHEGALLAKGMTVGVCGTGLNHVYPRVHRTLVEQILRENGAIISEFPLSTQPNARNFPRRNRIIAGLSLGVLVVEAAIKSGSLLTAQHALQQNREVFAIPGSIHSPLVRGCHYLIQQGAKLVETVADILQELHPRHQWRHQKIPDENTDKNPSQKHIYSDLSPSQQKILHYIDYEITSLDVILLRSGLTASELSSILLILELNGYIGTVPGGYTRLIV